MNMDSGFINPNAPVHQNPLVKVTITHNILKLAIPEVRFSLYEPICEMKCSITKRVGTTVSAMQLVLKNHGNIDNIYINSW